jgi:hypothetical protein
MTLAAASFGVASVAAQAPRHPTKTNVVCTHPTPNAGSVDPCGVSVTDISSHPTAPTGTVTLSTNIGPNHGTLSPTQCTLVPVNSRVSRCSFTYTPSTRQPTRIYANYAGDQTHAPSHGHIDLNAAPGPPPPPPPTTGEGLTCLGDIREDNADLAAAAIAEDRVLKAQIIEDILADRAECFGHFSR